MFLVAFTLLKSLRKGYVMLKFLLSFGVRKSRKNTSSFITQAEYKEIMNYARVRNIKLEGFKRFSGDIAIIKDI